MKRFLIGLLVLVVIAASSAWIFRKELILFAVTHAGPRHEIAPYRPLTWAQGPDWAPQADSTPAKAKAEPDRPPNIIFILADDLGINDISTFGGGVAGGRVQTPNIDRLAKSGGVFSQAYAGNATCAPSRAASPRRRAPGRASLRCRA